MKIKLCVFLCFLPLLTAACNTGSPEAQGLGSPGTKDSVQQIYRRMELFSGIGSHGPADPSFDVAVVLPKIHSWLKVGRGLRRFDAPGFSGVVLESLPDQVVDEISKITFGDDFKSGYLILQSSFWKQVKQVMNDGVRIGFMNYDPKNEVNGVTFPSPDMTVLVQVFASEGTLVHEYRHVAQYRKLDAHPGENLTLQSACADQASRFFAELDATTTELPTWVGVFQTIDMSPDLSMIVTGGKVDLSKVFISQQDLLACNLTYPSQAAQWVLGLPSDTACPSELNDAIQKISDNTSALLTKAGHDASLLVGSRGRAGIEREYLQDHCASGTTSLCTQEAADVSSILTGAQAQKDSIDQILASAQADRMTAIHAALTGLSAGVKRDLCWNAMGFENLVDCTFELSN